MHRLALARWFTSRTYIKALFCWTLLSTTALWAGSEISGKVVARAIFRMGAGLVLLWVVGGGLLMWRSRDTVRGLVRRIGLPWQMTFVLFCTILALLEETITTTLTNCAPWFGVPIGKAYITASTNYLDVVCCHSVVVFVPLFIGWAVLLGRRAFSPNAAFLLFGLTGTLLEVLYGGPQQLAAYGMWTFVYGWMVYLPAYSLPQGRDARPPRWWEYPMAVFFPILFSAPVAAVLALYLQQHHHPSVHFPPLAP